MYNGDCGKFEIRSFVRTKGPEQGLTFFYITDMDGYLCHDGQFYNEIPVDIDTDRCAGTEGYWNTYESAEEFLRQWQEEGNGKSVQPRHGDVVVDHYGTQVIVLCDDKAVGGLRAVNSCGRTKWGDIMSIVEGWAYWKHEYKPIYNVFD